MGNFLVRYASRVVIYDHRAVIRLALGNGCGSVGRAVASDTRGPPFESSQRQKFIQLFIINCIEKTKLRK